MDNHVMTNICTPNFDTTNTKLTEFCSCVQPTGYAKRILEENHYMPKCWETTCVSKGYKLLTYDKKFEKLNITYIYYH